MPRQRDAVWDRFTEVVVNGITRAQCKLCNIEMVSLVARMKQHAESCRKFIAKEPPYSASLFEGSYLKVDPMSCSKSGKRLGVSESLIKVAVSLCSALASSSGLERHFSRLGLTYGCLRTRLGVEKAGKLAFLHHN